MARFSRSARDTRSYVSARFRRGCANVCSYLQIASLILRIRPRDIIYMGRVANKGVRGEGLDDEDTSGDGGGCWLLAAVTPGHDSASSRI